MVIVQWEIIFGVVLVCCIDPTFSKHRLPKKTAFEDVPESFASLLDASCLSNNSRKAPSVLNARLSYATKRTLGGEKQVFLLATYDCFGNRELLNGNAKLYCSNRKWLGARPICLNTKETQFIQSDDARVLPLSGANDTCPQEYAKECDQDCTQPDGKPTCRCYPGFKMNNGHCEDINECSSSNGGCQQICSNLLGSFICSCRQGFRLQSNGHSCEDVNECLLRNGHGPCEDSCANENGSYKCSCTSPGLRLAADNHSCDDIDECVDGTSGCSHGCINTRGQGFCTCPNGMVLSNDWKTCEERALSDQPAPDDNNGDYGDDDEEDYGNEEEESDYGDEENENDRDVGSRTEESNNQNIHEKTVHNKETVTIEEQFISSTHIYDVFNGVEKSQTEHNRMLDGNENIIRNELLDGSNKHERIENSNLGISITTLATYSDSHAEKAQKHTTLANNINDDYEEEEDDEDYNEEDENSTEEDYVETTTILHHTGSINNDSHEKDTHRSGNPEEHSGINQTTISSNSTAGLNERNEQNRAEANHVIDTQVNNLEATLKQNTSRASKPSPAGAGDSIEDKDSYDDYVEGQIQASNNNKFNGSTNDNIVNKNSSTTEGNTNKLINSGNEKNAEDEEYDYGDEDYNEEYHVTANKSQEAKGNNSLADIYNSTEHHSIIDHNINIIASNDSQRINQETTTQRILQNTVEETNLIYATSQENNTTESIETAIGEESPGDMNNEHHGVAPSTNSNIISFGEGSSNYSTNVHHGDIDSRYNGTWKPMQHEHTTENYRQINAVEKPPQIPTTNPKEAPGLNPYFDDEDEYDYDVEEELDRDRDAAETDYKKNADSDESVTDIVQNKSISKTVEISHVHPVVTNQNNGLQTETLITFNIQRENSSKVNDSKTEVTESVNVDIIDRNRQTTPENSNDYEEEYDYGEEDENRVHSGENHTKRVGENGNSGGTKETDTTHNDRHIGVERSGPGNNLHHSLQGIGGSHRSEGSIGNENTGDAHSKSSGIDGRRKESDTIDNKGTSLDGNNGSNDDYDYKEEEDLDYKDKEENKVIQIDRNLESSEYPRESITSTEIQHTFSSSSQNPLDTHITTHNYIPVLTTTQPSTKSAGNASKVSIVEHLNYSSTHSSVVPTWSPGHTTTIPTVNKIEHSTGHTSIITTTGRIEHSTAYTSVVQTSDHINQTAGHTPMVPNQDHIEGELEYDLDEFNEIIRNEKEKSQESTSGTPSSTNMSTGNHKDYDDEDYEDEDDAIESSGDGPHHRVNAPVNGRCSKGFEFNEDRECADIDECEDPENGCSDYCENSIGSYKCTCGEGYEITPGDKYTCHDIDECLKRLCSHTCLNLLGSYVCECPEGWYLSNNTCEKIICSHSHEIVDNRLVCGCPTGFTLRNSTTCDDINECDGLPCDQICKNTPGSYECRCDSGYVLIEGGRCVDRDECEEGLCSGPCRNLNGSYACICDEGYTYDEFTKACVDIDECIDRNLHDCSHTCVNTEGSYDCACRDGYVLHLDGATCEDINECFEEDVCGQLCNNTLGSYQCYCKIGFTMNGNKITCDDINECFEYNGNCTHFCANLEGSYECACDPGYDLGSDNRTCIEINPCDTNNGGCSHTCENIGGLVACGCPKDHELIGTTCFKTNPCKIDNGGCSHKCDYNNNTVTCLCPHLHVLSNNTHCELIDPCFEENGGCSHFCENVNGTAVCKCPDQTYELNHKKCFKINPCLHDNGGCSHVCKFNNGSIVCECLVGYKLVNKQCLRINLCEFNNGGCSHFCEFANEQVVCACPENYELMGNDCEMVDPCMIDNGGCSHECVSDEDGNVSCFCPPKYVLQGNNTCIQQNPCFEENGGCTHICVNHRGRPKCFCPFNYELLGKTCVKIDPCMENNGNCSHICNHDSGSVICGCPQHLILTNETTCTNPCSLSNGGCSHQCTIINGKIKCSCPKGFELQVNTCISTDPCIFNNGGCSHQCTNIGGKAVCKCPDRYQLKGKNCRRTNPCLINNGGCSNTCTNHRGRAKCSCPTGYSLQGKICIDNEPCSKNNGNCSHVCSNNNGLRICSCPSGYLLRPNKRICKDVNECAVYNGGCSHECRNLPGSYSCQCPTGYKMNPDRRTCDVENLCENNGGCQHICKSYENGRRCECYEGYTLSNDGKTCEKINVPQCRVSNIPNSMVKCTGLQPNSTYAPQGTRCYIWCDKGYKLVGGFSMTCSYGGSWDIDEPHCTPVSCPKLIHPDNGRLVPSTCGSRKSLVGERCKIYCRRGFKADLSIQEIVCEANLQWSPSISEEEMKSTCRSDIPKPFIRCPSGGVASFNLPPGQNTMMVKISRPDSNVDWWRYVTSNPAWGMKLGTTLPPGRFDVTYTAYSPNMNSSSSCVLMVEVKDAEPPKMTGCPTNIDIRLSRGEFTRNVHWQEPHFEDNIAIRTLYKSKESGTSLGPGEHNVNYVASDDAGNRAFCHFTITIKDADFSDNRPGRYRAVLICPHGVQYMSNPPDHYDNTITTQQGCHWSHIRVRETTQLSRYKIPSRSYYETNSYKNNHVNSESTIPHQIRLRHTPFTWYNRCC